MRLLKLALAGVCLLLLLWALMNLIFHMVTALVFLTSLVLGLSAVAIAVFFLVYWVKHRK